MKDPKESLSQLLASVEKVELASVCEKLRAIINFTDQFTPEMSDVPDDEFLIHIASMRKDAIDLLAECGKVSGNGNSDQLTGIKSKFQTLKEFVEFLFVLRGDDMVEQAHAAL